MEVFAQLHTISQFEMDSKPVMPIIFAGQNNLLDKLLYYTSRPSPPEWWAELTLRG